MPEDKIKPVAVPKYCTHKVIMQAIADSCVMDVEKELISFVFDKDGFTSSSALAFLCSWGLRQRDRGCSFNFTGDDNALNYLSRMDLFRHLGFVFNERFERRSKTGRFLPILLVDSSKSVCGAVNEVCDLVLHQFDNAREFLPAMEWAINEVVDNIFLHSDTAVPGVICAQYFPQKHHLDIGICDMGRGIYASLSESQNLVNHSDALTKALMRGITRNSEIGQGNGLAGSLDITQVNHGSFQIWTGDACFKLDAKGTQTFTKIPEISGTGISISLDTRNPVNLGDTFIGQRESIYIFSESERVSDGEGLKIAEECLNTGTREPAKTLRRKIMALLPDMDVPLILNFIGVRGVSSSFLDELFGRLYIEIGPKNFIDKIRIVNAGGQIMDMANVVTQQRVESMKAVVTGDIAKELALRAYLREPIAEIFDAARYLDASVSAHFQDRSDIAEELIRLADIPAIREWTDSLWGKNSPHVQYRVISEAPPTFTKKQRGKDRMPTLAEKKLLLERDGYHCRFCGIPLIRMEVRGHIRKLYPQLPIWGKKITDCHAAFQAMWLQYDHLLPHSRGGKSELGNMLITCAPCNYARMSFTLEEVGLADPRTREPIRSTWDGLERIINKKTSNTKLTSIENCKSSKRESEYCIPMPTTENPTKTTQAVSTKRNVTSTEFGLAEYVDYINKNNNPLVSGYLNELIAFFQANPDLFFIKPGLGKKPSLVIKNNLGKTFCYLSSDNYQLAIMLPSQIEFMNHLREKYSGSLSWSLPFELGKWPSLNKLENLTSSDFDLLKEFTLATAHAANGLIG